MQKEQQKVPLVQGYNVDNDTTNYQSGAVSDVPPTTGGSTFNGTKGEEQPKQFQDSIWAIVFIGHLAVMGFTMFTMDTGDGSFFGGDASYGGLVWMVSVCGLVAVVLSTMALGIMMKFADEFVRLALYFSIACSLAIAVVGYMTGQTFLCIIAFASAAIGFCYARAVKDRIPFAASNLRTGLAAVKSNMGIIIVAYMFLVLAFGWTIGWSVTAGSTLRSVGQATLFFFLLSYYWVHQVFQNTVHVTTTGIVGTWWFVPLEANGFCSSAIKDSLLRATTFSFGSICFGSFLVALIQTLRTMHRMARENNDAQMLLCIVDCILGCIESFVEYVNKWAYVYVGLYGYSYLEAGSNVMTLFQNKGWSTIITDDLATNVLFMVTIVIGLITSLIGLVMGKANPNVFAELGIEDGGIAGFVLGFLVGNLFSTIMMSVVASAINTVIVLFAEAPLEFENNHPQLYQDMMTTWRQAWPTEYQ